MRKYIKDPRMQLEAKKHPYYIIDSTYTVASDPNTMRDTGATRNALYFFRDDIDSLMDKQSTVSAANFNMRKSLKSTAKLNKVNNR